MTTAAVNSSASQSELYPIQFLGLGGAFDFQFGSSSAVITGIGPVRILIDCGCTTYRDLREADLADSITQVLITHMHDDHVGSLGTLIFHHYYLTHNRLQVLAPGPLMPYIRNLLAGQITHGPIDEFVSFTELHSSEETEVGGWAVTPVDTFGRHQPNMQSYAYVFQSPALRMVYSGDLGDPDLLFNLPQPTNVPTVFFHDVCFTRLSNKAHAFHEDVERHLGAHTVLGYHNNPRSAPPGLTVPLVYQKPELLVPHRRPSVLEL